LPLNARTLRRLRRRARTYRSTILLLLVVVVASAAWVGVRGLLAARNLRALDQDITSLQIASSDPNNRQIPALAAALSQHSHRAAANTHDVVWKLWSRVPVIGPPMRVVSGISDQAEQLTSRALPTLVDVAMIVRGLRRPDGSLSVEPLAQRAPALQRAQAVLVAAAVGVDDLPSTDFAFVNRNRSRLAVQLHKLASRAQALTVGAQVAPEVLGLRGSRLYLIAVQNNAESRASGGIVGAYGVLRIVNGNPDLLAFESDAKLQQLSTNAIDFGPEWRSRYDAMAQARDWREVTSTPDFPTAARAMLAMSSAVGGPPFDGVLSVDAPGLADILQATGPVTTRTGRQVLASTFVASTLSDAYRQFPDKEQRTAVLSDNARAVFSALVNGAGAPLTLGERLGHAIIGGHLRLFSTSPSTQSRLATTELGGVLPTDRQPLLSVVTQDTNADKLSYYLRRNISYRTVAAPRFLDFGDGHGPQPQEVANLTIRLTNTAPISGLPDYVAPRIDLSTGLPLPRGEMHLSLSVYLGRDGLLDGATVDNHAVPTASQTEKGLSVLSVNVVIPAGASRTVRMAIRQPDPTSRPLHVLPQPLVLPDALDVDGVQVRI
jgi:hypothetical protein